MIGKAAAATVLADQIGAYACTFEAAANRECPPPFLTIGPAVVNVTAGATLTLAPSSISATTPWSGMPVGLNESVITVTWDPPECVGTLEIVEIEGTGGYVPPTNGTLDQVSDTEWRYTAFDEPQAELCPNDVKVWIGAFQGDTELTRKSILVWPVHVWWRQIQQDLQKDFDYIAWKYAAVLATTGAVVSNVGITISEDSCVGCPPIPFAPCVSAWTSPLGNITFGTDTFAGSENQAASIIGHELIHTTGGDECAAYTWEFNNDSATGIFQCDSGYLADVVVNMNCRCSGIGCP